MPSVALSSVLQALVLLGSALTVFKLLYTGLYKQYPIFFLYFLIRIPNTIWPMVLDVRSDAYFFVYLGTLPVVIVLYILMVMELYRLVLKDYQGLQTAGKWAMYLSVAGAVAISIATLIPKFQPSLPQRSRVMGMVVVSERGVYTALAVFIILLLALLSRYPIELRRNVRVHAVIYSAFFLNGGLVMLARSVLGLKSMDTWYTVAGFVNVVCVFAWFALLSPDGEKVSERKAGAATENERRLILQLEGLNTALLRVSRQKVG